MPRIRKPLTQAEEMTAKEIRKNYGGTLNLQNATFQARRNTALKKEWGSRNTTPLECASMGLLKGRTIAHF